MTYRIRTSEGVTTEVDLTPKQIEKRFPGAVITHRIKVDDRGIGTPHPYFGDQPDQPDDESEGDESENAPEDENKGGTRDAKTDKRESPTNGKETARVTEITVTPKRGR
jgi:hypothetical protein